MGESASLSPSVSPSVSPSSSPSSSPSVSASRSPSVSPSVSPSASPSVSPSPLPAGLVDYTLRERLRIGRKHIAFTLIEFGSSGNDAYPSGGIPLTTSQLGLNSTVNAVIILESNASALLYEWDRSANTLRQFSQDRVETPEGTIMATAAVEVMVIGW